MPQPPAALATALADRYRLERKLGEGGMAEVIVERFRREIRLAAGLQRPPVVPVLSTGSAHGLLWFTMPFIEGESLRAPLVRERGLPVPETVRLLREVAGARAVEELP